MDVSKLGITADQFCQQLMEQGVLCSTRPSYQVRMVANRYVSSADVDTVIDEIKAAIGYEG